MPSLQMIRSLLTEYEYALKPHEIGTFKNSKESSQFDLLHAIARYILTSHAGRYSELPIEERKDPNPFPFPSKEDYIPLFDFRVKCGNNLSDTFIRQAFQKYPDFFKTCGARYGVKNHIQFNRALHWLWDNGSLTIRNKLIKYKADFKAKTDAMNNTQDKINFKGFKARMDALNSDRDNSSYDLNGHI